MRILAVDVGTGTQDILLWDSGQEVENALQLVMPSPTVLVANRVREATKRSEPIVLTGVTMGGGPSTWAVEEHLRAGLAVAATLPAAQSFDDDSTRLREMGIELVDEAEATSMPGVHVEMRDFCIGPIEAALRAFGVELRLDAVAVAVFDHGAAPPGESDRIFRFRYLADTLAVRNDLTAFAHRRDAIPAAMTRLAAVAATVPERYPLVVMDTAPAAILGALEDPRVAGEDRLIAANVGNYHALACHLEDGRVVGVFEHHTGELARDELVDYLERLARGDLSSEEVYRDMGHGAIVWPRSQPPPSFFAITGPRRATLAGTRLNPYFAVPYGDMMLAGCFGLLRACAAKWPDRRDEIEEGLRPGSRAPW